MENIKGVLLPVIFKTGLRNFYLLHSLQLHFIIVINRGDIKLSVLSLSK